AASRFEPVSIMTVWPTLKPARLSTLTLVVPACEPVANVLAAGVIMSVQLFSSSWPSGKRPTLMLVFTVLTGDQMSGKAGNTTKQPLFSNPEVAWYPSEAQGSTRPP